MSADYPLLKFHFEVIFGVESKGVSFSEISGLDIENRIIEYRNGNSKNFAQIKMPGLKKFGNVVLKRGIIDSDSNLWRWFSEIKLNTIKRRTVIIRLLDENGEVSMQWTLENAWPTKISSTDLKSEENEIAIEALELAYEGISIGK